jgi:hypothetical protein
MLTVLLDEGKLRNVKQGAGKQAARIILTTPMEYLESLERRQVMVEPEL